MIPEGFACQQEAAWVCGLSQARIAQLVTRGIIESVDLPTRSGRTIKRIRRETLELFVSSGCPRPKRPGRPRVHAPRACRKKAELPGLTSAEIAARLSLSGKAASRLLERGIIKSVNHGKGRGMGYRVAPEDLESFIGDRS